MKDQVMKAWNSIREFWSKLSKKMKMLIGFGALGVLIVAVALTAYLNLSAGQYKVLFPGIESTESAEVYATLESMSVKPQINQNGEVMVPKDQWDNLVFELAGKGFPKTAPAYGVFFDNTGFTTTEFEKKQALLFQVQNRIQETLSRIEGVEGTPVVTVTVPDESAYVWQDQQEESTASVLIGMRTGYTLTPERVSAIRNLVAFSVPKLKPENVVVADQKSGVEMQGLDEGILESGVDFKRIEYERELERGIEDKIKRLLAPRYGSGVTAVAKVTVDYDKTKMESKTLVPEKNGKGVETHYEDRYNLNGAAEAGGIVGEENNTDVPQYPQNTGTGDGQTTDFERSIDYDTSYDITQVEKGQAVVKTLSVAVVVNDSNFTTEREDLLKDLIANGVSVDKSRISVTNLDFTEGPAEPAGGTPDGGFKLTVPMLIILGASLLLVLVIILIVVLIFRRRAKKRQEEEIQSETVIRDLQKEVEQHKRELMETAKANSSKDTAITNEVRNFAKENPEITASLIRSMLKEDE